MPNAFFNKRRTITPHIFLRYAATRPHVVNGLRAICCGCRRRLDFRLPDFLAAQMRLGVVRAVRDRGHCSESDGGLRTNVSSHPKRDRQHLQRLSPSHA